MEAKCGSETDGRTQPKREREREDESERSDFFFFDNMYSSKSW